MGSIKRNRGIVVVILFLVIVSNNAYAYIDPGTGSYLFQILIATLIGVLFSIKIYSKKIVALVKSIIAKGKKEEKNELPPEN